MMLVMHLKIRVVCVDNNETVLKTMRANSAECLGLMTGFKTRGTMPPMLNIPIKDEIANTRINHDVSADNPFAGRLDYLAHRQAVRGTINSG